MQNTPQVALAISAERKLSAINNEDVVYREKFFQIYSEENEKHFVIVYQKKSLVPIQRI